MARTRPSALRCAADEDARTGGAKQEIEEVRVDGAHPLRVRTRGGKIRAGDVHRRTTFNAAKVKKGRHVREAWAATNFEAPRPENAADACRKTVDLVAVGQLSRLSGGLIGQSNIKAGELRMPSIKG